MTPEELAQFDKLWDRVTWLLKLQASNADQRLQLADRVAKNTQSVDRLTEGLLQIRQKLGEIYEQREYVRAALEHLNSQLTLLSKDVDHVERSTRETRRPRRVTPTAVKLFDRYRDAPRRVQVLILILISLVAAGGWLQSLIGRLVGH